jgi:hypothetical protein
MNFKKLQTFFNPSMVQHTVSIRSSGLEKHFPVRDLPKTLPGELFLQLI